MHTRPQNAVQSLAMSPAPMTSLPRLHVPATRGTCSRLDSSSRSSTDVCGCTCGKTKHSLQTDVHGGTTIAAYTCSASLHAAGACRSPSRVCMHMEALCAITMPPWLEKQA